MEVQGTKSEKEKKNGKPFPPTIGDYRLLRSDAVQEIVSRKPGFVEQWALPVFFLILVLLFVGAWFIRYPDIIQANATLTADNAPKEVVTRQDGKVVRIFVGNDDMVRQDQSIAYIESTASHEEVLKLSVLLDSGIRCIGRNEMEKVSALYTRPFNRLGELQASYQQFITAWQQFNDYLQAGYYFRKRRMLLGDMDLLQKAHANLETQRSLAQQDFQLAQEAFDASSSLFRDTVISKQDLRDGQSKLIGKQVTRSQLQSSLLLNENDQAAKHKEIEELDHTISQQKIIFQQALMTLRSLADDWIRKYIIRAPVGGKISFIVPLQENQFVSSGKILGFVNPPDTRYYAQLTLPQGNFGKIDTGQRTQLRFDAYPYQEFGSVSGKLTYVSKIPSDSGFLANISLPDGLRTNYSKDIQYRSGLKCQALVITKDARLLDRLYYNFVKSMQR